MRGVGAWILGGLALITAVHLDDQNRVEHISGAWMALAQYTADGTLYPWLYDGEWFGGTRFMPLQFVLRGALANATGDLVSGKLVVLAATVALLALMLIALRRVRVPIELAIVLLGAVVATQAGLSATTSIRGDALPVALQLGAIVLVGGSGGRNTVGLPCSPPPPS